MWSAARSAKISMILCMPERVSGGDVKFQDFCDRWNKCEGQVRQRPGKRSGKAFRDVEAKPGGRPTLKSGPWLHRVVNQQCLLSEFQQEAGYPHLNRYARKRDFDNA